VSELSVVPLASDHFSPAHSSSSPPDSARNVEFTYLIIARDHVALLVDRHGAEYLPLFVRLDDEVAAHHASESMVERARRLARSAAARADAA
jgi:hypothetical protein